MRIHHFTLLQRLYAEVDSWYCLEEVVGQAATKKICVYGSTRATLVVEPYLRCSVPSDVGTWNLSQRLTKKLTSTN